MPNIYIGDLLNRIKWDKNIKLEEYTIAYFDSVAGKNFEVPFKNIIKEGNFMTIGVGRNKISIPLHRIRQVKRNGKLIWDREGI